MNKWVKALLLLTPMGIALIASIVIYLSVENSEVRTYKIWTPENGRESDILDVKIEMVNGVGHLSSISEVSLQEFQNRHYSNVVYGVWSEELSKPYVYYWAFPDPIRYPSGIWARSYLPIGFGQMFGGISVTKGNTVTIGLTKSWDEGKTFIPTVGPKMLIILTLFTGLVGIFVSYALIKWRQTIAITKKVLRYETTRDKIVVILLISLVISIVAAIFTPSWWVSPIIMGVVGFVVFQRPNRTSEQP